MAVEQFANLAQTTLNGSITNIATTLTVTSATGFPASGQFRIIIDNEIILVTAVSGTTFTIARGAEGTTGAAHSSGVLVTHVVTAASLSNALNQNYVTTGGTSTAYTVTFSPVPTTYTTGPFFINFNATNTGAATLNPNSLGAKTIQYQGNALVAGQIIGGTTYVVIYDGTQYQIIGSAPQPPQITAFSNHTSGTYTTPSGCKCLFVRGKGSGGGGGGVGQTAQPSGSVGGNTSFGTSLFSASGGNGGIGGTNTGNAGGSGGAASGGYLNLNGGSGQVANSVIGAAAGSGGSGGGGGGGSGGASVTGGTNTGVAGQAGGGGGGAGGTGSLSPAASGGGEGGYFEGLIVNPNSTYSYAVGTGGAGGIGSGVGAATGGAGGDGWLIVEARF